MLLGGEVINVLRWQVEQQDRRRSSPPADVQPYPAFLGQSDPGGEPGRAAVVGVHRGAPARRPAGRLAGGVVDRVEVGEQLRAGERFVYAYYGGIDKIAHERGFNDVLRRRAAHRRPLVADVVEQLTVRRRAAGHRRSRSGQVGDKIVHPSDELLGHVSAQSGEGRFRWLHARRGASPTCWPPPRTRSATSPGWSRATR
jgi:hypothetical protein